METLVNTCADINPIGNSECLEKKARKLAAFSNSAATTGNTIAIFAMLVLQEILEQEATNPINNITNIITIADSIANLNASIHPLVS